MVSDKGQLHTVASYEFIVSSYNSMAKEEKSSTGTIALFTQNGEIV